MQINCVFVCISLIFITVIHRNKFIAVASPLRKHTISKSGSAYYGRDDEISIEFVPQCNNNKTFCENVDIYPEDVFYAVLRNSPYEREYFKLQRTIYDDLISDRLRKERELYLCSSQTMSYFPRVALNAKNEWKYVYNLKDYKQGILTEECGNTAICTSMEKKPEGIKTKCVQKYVDRLLLVSNEKGEPVWDLFWLPSACVCAYEAVINFNIFNKKN